MCSMRDNSLNPCRKNSKLSYNQTLGLESNRSPGSSLVSLRKIPRKISEQTLCTKAAPQSLNMLKNYSGKFERNLPKSDLFVARNSELAQNTDTNETLNKHYFNNKYIDERQTKMQHKIWANYMDTRGKSRRKSVFQASGDRKSKDPSLSLFQIQRHRSHNRLQETLNKSPKDFTLKLHSKDGHGANSSFSGLKGAEKGSSTLNNTPGKKLKTKGYIFLRKAKRNHQKDSYKTSDVPVEFSTSSPNPNENTKLTQNNSKLIAKIINRERNHSLSYGSQAQLHSKLIILSKNPRKNVLKKVMDSNKKQSCLNETHINASLSQESSQKSPPERVLQPSKFSTSKNLVRGSMFKKHQPGPRNSSKEMVPLKIINQDQSQVRSTLKALIQGSKLSKEGPSETKINHSGQRNEMARQSGEEGSKVGLYEEIKNNIKIPDKIKEDQNQRAEASESQDFTPKLALEMHDTWNPEPSSKDDSCGGILKDIKGLQLKYKLREGWHDNNTNQKKPFDSDISVILPLRIRDEELPGGNIQKVLL
ncbi:unnamed protein product [Moneuplotes crassus]|uniref:Uncharacterized protein n=1 Tax=Euplotes crassus TaxID=5936 RepID=A0AAD1U4G9_EUPCR|nr:unnamed protein product [Moneuplotes crassus]